jgi:PncC family amidohydrolase
MLTEVPGSSRYFLGGVVSYTNQLKIQMLGVLPLTLAAHGAVSEQVVSEMAVGARQRLSADYALAVSGVAGPDGGTAEKPVGMVCIGMAGPMGVVARTPVHVGDRTLVRDRACKSALTMLRYELLGKPMPF